MNIKASRTDLYLPSSEEMIAFDTNAINSGTPSLELMERAGRGVVDRLVAEYTDALQRVLILCGPGNNGGDGYVVGRLLLEAGYSVACLRASSDRASTDNHINATRFGEAGGMIYGIQDSGVEALCDEATLIIDALLGTGQRDVPKGEIAEIIQLVTDLSVPTISIDVPTGIDSGTGAVYSLCIVADATYGIQCIKRGVMQYPARSMCGDLVVVDIGITCDTPTKYSLFNQEVLAPVLRRDPAMHKGEAGTVLIIGGSPNMPGAPYLAAESALRAGCGKVVKLHPASQPVIPLCFEVMYQRVKDTDGFFTAASIDEIEESFSSYNAVVLGPGLGVSENSKAVVIRLLALAGKFNVPVVIDADALTLLSSIEGSLDLSRCILTPHPGEAASLLGCSSIEVQKDRFLSVEKIHSKTAAVVLLKGAGTITLSYEGGIVNSTGNPYMATAGSGDVLSGIIAAFVAQGLSLFDAAAAGVYVHGLAGDIAASQSGGPICATDITHAIGTALGSLR